MTNKFKSLTKKQKIGYIWDFYKIHIAIVIAVLGIISSYAIRWYNHVDTNVYCLVFNDPENEDLKQHIMSTYSEYINNDKMTASVDIGYIFSYDQEEKMNWPNNSSSVKYAALQASGDADTIITDYDSMLWTIKQDFITPVKDILPEDLYHQLEPYFVYMEPKDTTDKSKTKIVYGLDITNSKIYKGHSYNYDKAILCFPNVSKDPDAAIRFAKYMYGLK